MDTTPSTFTQAPLGATVPAKRLLDPSAEWRDCANHWDVSELWRTPPAAPNLDPRERSQAPRTEPEH
jgi:hypothetical protein